MTDHEVTVGCQHRLGLPIGHPDQGKPCTFCEGEGVKPRVAIAMTIHGPADDPRASAAELYDRRRRQERAR